jgi:hypothetical protein
MIRAFLLAAALWGTAAPAQEAAAAASSPEAASDPVAAWQADPTPILPADGVDLDAFLYVARPLVVFSDSPADPQFVEQRRLLEADPTSLALRDVAVIVDTDPAARSAVRQALRPRGFGVVLLDKDGRVGLRRPSPQTVRELARAIDRMPLRQEEIRNGRAGEG